MAVARRRPRELTPNERVKERQVQDRADRARPRELAESWVAAARAWCRANGRELGRVLDLFDELAALHVYCGATWDDAQAKAWTEALELLTRDAA